MEPIPIRLTRFEVKAILDLLQDAVIKCADGGDIRVETIVLAEFHLPWYKKHLASFTKKPSKKLPLYQMPVSVARILHYRLQQLPFNHTNQFILSKLDMELTNREMKPKFPTKLI